MHISRSLRCAHFAHGSCIFTDKWESRFFLKCHQRLVCFGVKRINFSFRSVIKNRRAGTVWTVYCASATDYQRKKISDNSQKKSGIRMLVTYMLDIGIHFLGQLPTAFYLFCIPVYALISEYIFLNLHKEFAINSFGNYEINNNSICK